MEHKERLGMNWIEITAYTTNEGVEAVSEIFYQAGITGLAIYNPKDLEQFNSHPGDWDYVDEALFIDEEDEVLVKGYLPDEAQSYDKIQQIRNSLAELLEKDLGIDIGKEIGRAHV